MALTADIITPRYGAGGNLNNKGLTANATVYRGSVATTRSGYLVAASSPASTDIVWGIIADGVGSGSDTQGITGASTNGGVTVDIETGTFFLAGGTSSDALVATDVGATVYLIDEQTVGKTSNGNTRPVAGVLEFVDPTYGLAVKLGSNQSTGSP